MPRCRAHISESTENLQLPETRTNAPDTGHAGSSLGKWSLSLLGGAVYGPGGTHGAFRAQCSRPTLNDLLRAYADLLPRGRCG